MLRRYVGLVEWWEGEPMMFTSWSLRRLRRKVAVHLDEYLKEGWGSLPEGFNPDDISPLNPDSPRSVKAFLREVRKIPDWGYPTFYRIAREDQPIKLIHDFV
jgi:hypothetical protein